MSRLSAQEEAPVNKVENSQAPNDSDQNFIAEIKNAANQAQNETGFIYEPTSGLYYDSRTGYYYNAVCCFYHSLSGAPLY